MAVLWEIHLSPVTMESFLGEEKLLLSEQWEERECQARNAWEHSEMNEGELGKAQISICSGGNELSRGWKAGGVSLAKTWEKGLERTHIMFNGIWLSYEKEQNVAMGSIMDSARDYHMK